MAQVRGGRPRLRFGYLDTGWVAVAGGEDGAPCPRRSAGTSLLWQGRGGSQECRSGRPGATQREQEHTESFRSCWISGAAQKWPES